MQECLRWGSHVGGAAAPPVVDEQVERGLGFDVVPPHARNENGIAGLHGGDLGVLHGFGEFGEAGEIRGGEVHQADGLAGGGAVHGPDVQVADLLWRKQREAPFARHHAGEVAGEVVVGGDARFAAEPEAGQGVRRHRHVVVGAKARQPLIDRRGTHVDGGNRAFAPRVAKPLQHLRKRGLAAAEVEAGALVVVEEALVDGFVADVHGHRRVGAEPAQVAHGRSDGTAAVAYRRPVGDQAAQQHRLGGVEDMLRHGAVGAVQRRHGRDFREPVHRSQAPSPSGSSVPPSVGCCPSTPAP